MLLADGALGLALLAVWVYCVLDVVSTDPSSVRNLPKLTWVLLVVALPDVGSVAWLVAGRPQRQAPRGDARIPPEYDRPGRAVASSPDDDVEFLAQLKARADEQRARAAEQAKRTRDAEDDPPQA